jgi:hypothetical protein
VVPWRQVMPSGSSLVFSDSLLSNHGRARSYSGRVPTPCRREKAPLRLTHGLAEKGRRDDRFGSAGIR